MFPNGSYFYQQNKTKKFKFDFHLQIENLDLDEKSVIEMKNHCMVVYRKLELNFSLLTLMYLLIFFKCGYNYLFLDFVHKY